ncbi:MAG: S41 family peptidase [Saprospiraceae bacterium]
MKGNLQFIVWVTCMLAQASVVIGCSNEEYLNNNKKYIIQAFDSIEFYSRHRLTYNLDSLEAQVLKQISDSTSHEEVIELLEYAIKAIDKHNYIISSEKYQQMETGTNPGVFINPYPFQSKMLEEKYAFVALSGFMGVDSIASEQYTDSLQRSILWLYNQQPKGWIIDLRHNSGGWIYPMLAGLGPLLGPGIKAFEMSGDRVVATYYYYKDTTDYVSLSDSVWFFEKQLPIAVMIGEGTGSAGELLTLSFRGNPKTALIGSPTYGISTGLHGFFMPDSNWVCVTNCIMTDRKKNGDGGQIHPDIIEHDPLKIFEKSYQWIDSNSMPGIDK